MCYICINQLTAGGMNSLIEYVLIRLFSKGKDYFFLIETKLLLIAILYMTPNLSHVYLNFLEIIYI